MACNEVEFNKSKTIEDLKMVAQKESMLLEREAGIKTKEKKVDALIKRYKLEKQINDS